MSIEDPIRKTPESSQSPDHQIEFRLTTLEELILLIARQLEGRAYVVNVMKNLNEYRKIPYNSGAISITLRRLEKNGYLESSLGTPQRVRGGRAIRFYKTTEIGISTLEQMESIRQNIRRILG